MNRFPLYWSIGCLSACLPLLIWMPVEYLAFCFVSMLFSGYLVLESYLFFHYPNWKKRLRIWLRELWYWIADALALLCGAAIVLGYAALIILLKQAGL